jgi:hypothetical protein
VAGVIDLGLSAETWVGIMGVILVIGAALLLVMQK